MKLMRGTDLKEKSVHSCQSGQNKSYAWSSDTGKWKQQLLINRTSLIELQYSLSGPESSRRSKKQKKIIESELLKSALEKNTKPPLPRFEECS